MGHEPFALPCQKAVRVEGNVCVPSKHTGVSIQTPHHVWVARNVVVTHAGLRLWRRVIRAILEARRGWHWW